MQEKKSVVVIEDEQDIASSLKYFLEKNDFEVIIFCVLPVAVCEPVYLY